MFIGVSRSNKWRLAEPPEPSGDKEFSLMREQFLDDASYRCSCCGFTSNVFQHVHHLDGDHTNNQFNNFSCRCPLCHLCEHLGYVADNKMGLLVFCPSLSQEQLNAYVRIAWVTRYQAQIATNPEKKSFLFEIARQTSLWIDLLKSTAVQVQQIYKIDNIRTLAEDFRAMNDAEFELRESKFPHLRLLFLPESFSREIEAWSNNANFFADYYAPENWPNIVKELINNKERANNGL